MNSSIRAYVQAKDDREGGDSEQFTFGPSVEFYRKPLLKLKGITLFDLNDAKSRTIAIESGYRVITAPDEPVENRAIEAVTFRLPLFAEILASDRNRADLDWQNASFSWRYRNRLSLERTFAVGSYHLIPYLQAEPFYESHYSKWSRRICMPAPYLPASSCQRNNKADLRHGAAIALRCIETVLSGARSSKSAAKLARLE